MDNKDKIIVGACVLQLAICVGIGIKVHASMASPNASNVSTLDPPQAISASSSVVIGSHPTFLGPPDAPFTLVEFGDFQCPPCAAADLKVKKQLKKYKSKLRFTFRNSPLTDMHPFAMSAAIMAERARLEQHYWDMHDGLYALSGKISDADILIVADQSGIKLNAPNKQTETYAARAAVDFDLKTAVQLNVHGTPSFFLCCPDGKVIRLFAPKQVSQYIPRS